MGFRHMIYILLWTLVCFFLHSNALLPSHCNRSFYNNTPGLDTSIFFPTKTSWEIVEVNNSNFLNYHSFHGFHAKPQFLS